MFLAPWKPKTTIFIYIYSVFASGSKNHGIHNVFWPETLVPSMLQEVLFSCQSQRHKNIVNYSNDLRNAPSNFGPFFPDPGPPKTFKPQQSEGFWGARRSQTVLLKPYSNLPFLRFVWRFFPLCVPCSQPGSRIQLFAERTSQATFRKGRTVVDGCCVHNLSALTRSPFAVGRGRRIC